MFFRLKKKKKKVKSQKISESEDTLEIFPYFTNKNPKFIKQLFQGYKVWFSSNKLI